MSEPKPESGSIAWRVIMGFTCLDHLFTQTPDNIVCVYCGAKGLIRLERVEHPRQTPRWKKERQKTAWKRKKRGAR